MNTFKFLQTGGFPMDVNVLDQMQTAYRLFNALGALAGDTAIIKGCTITGNTVSDGVVYINGEILEFRSGILADNVIIVQEAQSKNFENGISREVYYTRYAAFGVATTSYPWVGFKRVFPTTAIQGELNLKADKTAVAALQGILDLKTDKTTLTTLIARVNELERKNAIFQASGGMVLWNKPANLIPAGWQEVVDFRGRMPVGFNPEIHEVTIFNVRGFPGGTIKQPNDPEFADWNNRNGGAKKHTLTIDELPPHSHTYSRAKDYGSASGNATQHPDGGFDEKETAAVGGGMSFSILNPYRVVLFIEYIG